MYVSITKYVFMSILTFLLIFLIFLFSSEKNPLQIKDTHFKMRTILFTNARDESNIVEWAVHHLLLGFDTIVIFDHLSNPPLSNQFVTLNKSGKKGWLDARIAVHSIHWQNPVKLRLMRLAVDFAKSRKYDWMLYLDADEYLYLPKYRGVPHLLQQCKSADELAINWVMFGTNFMESAPPIPMEYRGRFAQEQGPGILAHFTRSREYLDKHVKCFVRPRAVKQITSPHFWVIFQPSRMATLHRMPMRPPYFWDSFGGDKIPVAQAWGYLAHYVHQSRETYVSRKIRLPADDTGGMRGDNSQTIHELYNEVENTQVRDRYLTIIEAFLRDKQEKQEQEK